MNPQYPARNGSRPSNGPFSQFDLDQMPDTPQRGAHHRRALSETFFRLPDDLLFDVSDVDFSALDIPTPTTTTTTKNITKNHSSQVDVPMAVDSSRSDESSSDNRSSGTTTRPPAPVGHLRSLSVDADFFEGLSFGGMALVGDAGNGGKTAAAGSASAFGGGEGGGGKRVGFHRRNHSMDGACSSSFEADSLMDSVKKAMTQEKLAELSLVDPKRAKRILANRQSAARSKERKIRYTSELERKVQTLQTEATTLSAQVTMLQRDTSGLNAENRELKLRLQAMEQQAHLRDALNETLREEVQRLRLATGQIPSNTNKNVAASRGANPFGSQQPSQFTASLGSSMNDQNHSKRQLHPNFLDFNQRV